MLKGRIVKALLGDICTRTVQAFAAKLFSNSAAEYLYEVRMAGRTCLKLYDLQPLPDRALKRVYLYLRRVSFLLGGEGWESYLVPIPHVTLGVDIILESLQ